MIITITITIISSCSMERSVSTEALVRFLMCGGIYSIII